MDFTSDKTKVASKESFGDFLYFPVVGASAMIILTANRNFSSENIFNYCHLMQQTNVY